jgi:hypothetical protein
MANYVGTVASEERIANIYDVVQSDMILTTIINGYATLPLISFSGTPANSDFCGILTTQFYQGFVDAGQTSEKIVYRTVGSPRRRPLESAWVHSKDAEAFVIDEVDGDVDE